MAGTGGRALVVVAASLVLAGCAFWSRAGIWSEIQDIRTAFETAAAEREQVCVDTPAMCRRRLKLAPDKSPDDPGAWSYETAPSYRTEFDIGLAHVRPVLKRTWLGLEYWNEITRTLADRTDAGEISERDAWLVTRKAREQSRQMMIEQVNHAADSGRDAEAWRIAAFVLLNRAVADLNAYTAARTAIPRAAGATTSPASAAPPCASGVYALRGGRLCVTPDGGVTTR